LMHAAHAIGLRPCVLFTGGKAQLPMIASRSHGKVPQKVRGWLPNQGVPA
jgi:hypothetical protein